MQKQRTEKTYLTVAELAAESHYDASAVWRHVRSGDIQAIMIGGRIRIPRASYEAFVKASRTLPGNGDGAA